MNTLECDVKHVENQINSEISTKPSNSGSVPAMYQVAVTSIINPHERRCDLSSMAPV